MSDTKNSEQIVIFDTTLRDGEQSPGATMTLEEKLQIAELLDDIGVDIIEAGFPIASDGDFEAVKTIAQRAENAVIAGLARAIAGDIDRCGEAVRHAKRGRTYRVQNPWRTKDQRSYALFRKHLKRGAGLFRRQWSRDRQRELFGCR